MIMIVMAINYEEIISMKLKIFFLHKNEAWIPQKGVIIEPTRQAGPYKSKWSEKAHHTMQMQISRKIWLTDRLWGSKL